jgi:heat shock protein HtpX
MNTIKTYLLMAGLMFLFMFLGYLFGGSGGMIVAFVIASIMNFVTYWYSDKIVLRIYHAREVTEADHPRLIRVVKRVTTQAMMPMPKVYIVPSRAPNAFATGRDQDNAAVAATEGILELLNDDELEGVIGHEMAHIKNKDMLIGTVAASFAGAIGLMASIARFSAIFGGVGGRDDNNRGGGVIGLLVMAIVAPLIAVLVQTAISRQREFGADAEGGRITNKFLPLASALEKLEHSPVKMNLDDHPATANLMIVNPLSGRGLTNLFSTHPPVAERVARLKELSERSVFPGIAG